MAHAQSRSRQLPDLATTLELLAQSGDGDLSYAGDARRTGLHGLIQYPAMMVPRMQGDFIDAIVKAHPKTTRVCDPFAGSGTVLTETLRRGLSFVGSDINPLSVLTCRVKTRLGVAVALEDRAIELFNRISQDKSNALVRSFPHRDKWFSRSAQISLSRIYRSIDGECDPDIRNVFWLTFAESIRRCSRSRTSTYKLHIRSDEEMGRIPHPLDVFRTVVNAAILRFQEEVSLMEEPAASQRRHETSCAHVALADARNFSSFTKKDNRFDLLISSPPYGDNRTTIPYGQFSYLPSSWLPMDQLLPESDAGTVATTHSLDTASLGGSARGAEEKAAAISKISGAFADFEKTLKKKKNSDGIKRVGAFSYDFLEAIKSVRKAANPGAYFIWVLGNRSVGGEEFPFDQVTKDLMESCDTQHVRTFSRTIPHKRMPKKNSTSDLMSTETILVMRSPE